MGTLHQLDVPRCLYENFSCSILKVNCVISLIPLEEPLTKKNHLKYVHRTTHTTDWALQNVYLQVSITLIAISTLIISAVSGYRSLCILAWGYGLGLGGYRYSLKMFALERVRAKHFTKAWGTNTIFVFENR